MATAIHKSRGFTLMPMIALVTLGLAVTIPTLSTASLQAAAPKQFATVVVHSGDDLWTLASNRTPSGRDVQSVVDIVIAENHLAGATVYPGQRLRIPI